MVVSSGESGGINDFVSLTKMQPPKNLTSPPSLSSSSNPPGSLVPQPILPLEIVEEILCRLPVKLLSQLRCVCKSWNSLISDPKFAKKHLRYSHKDFTRFHLLLNFMNPSCENYLLDYFLPSSFNDITPATTDLRYPLINQEYFLSIAGSCDGFLYSTIGRSFIVWNPSIKKLKMLPSLEIPSLGGISTKINHGFGYDHLSDRYKVVSIFHYICDGGRLRNQVHVHTLGPDSWRRIEDFPYDLLLNTFGIFVSGTLNWFALASNDSWAIVSFHLGKESYQEISQPDYGDESLVTKDLTVIRDCLCVVADKKTVSDIWLMKEYGIQESWTKLFRVTCEDPKTHPLTRVIYISKDDELLLDYQYKVGVYNPRNVTFKTLLFQYEGFITPWVYVESLLSPCS
ncbi:F-box/kelch-repeat protein At3g23880-like [Lotus japonicus]|uniref:F-box/kelch-repeat protein At3g23880-like n=1 Tax=Lotus japonicus TaxID=34305 RepID=UPI00258432F8|nr:F-box/kelch-repeat protein At3g23880-like [Lotus japonicus]